MTRRPRRRAARGGWRRRDPRPGRLVLPLLTLLAAGIAALLFWGPGPGRAADVVVPAGVGVTRIGGELARAGVVRSGAVFALFAEATGRGGTLKAGEYAFPARESLADVLERMAAGRTVRRFVTIPEGLTSAAAMTVLQAAPGLTGPAPKLAEGALLPETYDYHWGETRAAVAGRMEAAERELLSRLWRARDPTLPYGDPNAAVTLASIVEKETAKPEERPRIAAVFVNRLRAGMRLESDPTVIYGLTGGAPLGHGLKVSELAGKTPWNTYLVAGLPPGPIANPGRAALEAALKPAPTKDLYFVADGTGGHVFTSDYKTHLQNVSRWRLVERARAAG